MSTLHGDGRYDEAEVRAVEKQHQQEGERRALAAEVVRQINKPQLAPDSRSAEGQWATARGFDLKAPHWDDLDEHTREAVRRIVYNQAAAQRGVERAALQKIISPLSPWVSGSVLTDWIDREYPAL